jgi:hypothetical protein
MNPTALQRAIRQVAHALVDQRVAVEILRQVVLQALRQSVLSGIS